MNRFIFSVLCIFVFTTMNAGEVVINDKTKGIISYDHKIEYLKTRNLELNIHDVLELSENSFSLLDKNNLNFGFTSFVYWFRIKLVNESDENKNLILAYKYPLLNEIHFFTINDDTLKDHLKTGECKPFEERVYNNRNFLYPVDLKAHESTTVYIRIYNNGETIKGPLVLSTNTAFFIDDQKTVLINFFYYGFLFFALIFGLFLFVTNRDKTYLYFFFFTLFLSLFLFNTDGWTYKLFWRNIPWWANHSTVLFVIFSGISLLVFTKNYLNTAKYFSVIDKSIYLFIGFWGILFILSFTNYPFYSYIVRIVNYSAVALVIFIFTLTCLSFKKMFVEAFYFFLSFVFLLTGIVLYVMKNAGVLPENTITQYGVKLGFGIQILMLCFAVTYRFRKRMEMTNKELEERVKKRTEKIQIQNREIILQRDYLNYQKEKLEIQRKEIINSIEYAQRIQNALLPTERFISKIFLDGFLLFKPRNIVSGDFYWISKKEELTILVAADCTGHGVPGAFMSMLGISFLNEIINRIMIYNKEIKPHEILNELTNYITGTLTFNDHKENVKDGIDMGICIYNHEKSLLFYAGARRPLYHVRDSKLTTYKGDRLTVGYNFNRQTNFTTHRIEMKGGDIIYMFSDGYIDQIGDKTKKTFRTQRFKNLLKSICDYPMEEQQKALEDTFIKWKGNEEQIDDVLVVGVKF